MTTGVTRRSVLSALGRCSCCAGLAWPKSDGEDLEASLVPVPPLPNPASKAGCTFLPVDGSAFTGQTLARHELGNLARLYDNVTVLERDAIANFMGVRATIAFYQDDSWNAQAVPPEAGASHDGRIYLGVNLCQALIRFRGESTIIGLIAHEAAHLIQYREKRRTGGGPTRADPAFSGRNAELHADYLAGWYMAIKARYGLNRVNPAAFEEALDRLGDVDFTSPDPHGSPEQRKRALSAGASSTIRNASPTIDDAYRRGIEHVANIK